MITLNGNSVEFAQTDEGLNVVEFARKNGVKVQTLCFLKDCGNVAKCGLCKVLVNGKPALACNTQIADGDEIATESEELAEALQKRVSMLLDKHYFMCAKCPRGKMGTDDCEFLELVMATKAKAGVRYNPSEEEYSSKVDDRSKSIVIDRNRCVLCSRCTASCQLKTGTQSLSVAKLPETKGVGRGVCPSLRPTISAPIPNAENATAPDLDAKAEVTDICLDDTNCLLCGQCVSACPVAALKERSHLERVEEALADETKHVIVAPAPSVRASLGEAFGLPIGTDVTGKMYSALRELGFDKVFDINFAADLTIMEEGTELLRRIGILEGGHSNKLPMYTSCCPGWVRLVDKFAPELHSSLSTAKSPQQMFGAVAKSYYPETAGIDPKSVFVVTIMPCTAKKFEAEREGMFGADGDPNSPDIDAVLTTRELALLIRRNKIDFAELPDSEADPQMGEYTGAGTIFGVTGGVMEAALRTAADIVTGKSLEDVDYCAVEGFAGVREASVKLEVAAEFGGGEKTAQVAVVNGAANFFELQKSGKLEKYHFVEVMACPGGCVNGGGQTQVSAGAKLDIRDKGNTTGGFAGGLPEYVALRASVLRGQDRDGNFTNQKRKSHENAAVQKLYETWGVKPGEGVAHHLLHVEHTGK